MKRVVPLLCAALLGALLRPVFAPSPARADDPEMERLKARIAALEKRSFGDPVTQPPLDSPLTYLRGQATDTPPGYTHQILSLVSEVTAKQAFPWPLYIQITTAHDRGDAVGATARVSTTGDGWSSGFHAETFHDAGQGTTIGLNVEPHKKVEAGRSIGVNIQAVDWQMAGETPPVTTIDEAINVQCAPKARYRDGLRFDRGSRGARAIAVDGDWETGLDLGSAPLALGGADGVLLRVSPERRRLEVVARRTGRVVGHLSLTAREHGL